MLATELRHFKMRNMAQAGLGGGRKGDISIWGEAYSKPWADQPLYLNCCFMPLIKKKKKVECKKEM